MLSQTVLFLKSLGHVRTFQNKLDFHLPDNILNSSSWLAKTLQPIKKILSHFTKENTKHRAWKCWSQDSNSVWFNSTADTPDYYTKPSHIRTHVSEYQLLWLETEKHLQLTGCRRSKLYCSKVHIPRVKQPVEHPKEKNLWLNLAKWSKVWNTWQGCKPENVDPITCLSLTANLAEGLADCSSDGRQLCNIASW